MFLVDNLKRIGKASTIAVHVALIVGVSIYTLFGALTMQYLESPDRIKTSKVREAKAVKATLYQPPPIKFEEEENKDVAKFVRVYLGSEIAEFDPGVRDCLYHVIGNLLKRANCEADKIEEYIEVGNIDRCYEMARISNIPVEKAVTRQPQQTKATTVKQKMTIEEEIQKELNKWNFGNALIFAFTVITTIGYGHVAPVTFYGRLFCIVYGVIGVPFTLLTIADLGMFIMKIIRMIINYIKKGISYVRKFINSRLNPQSDEKSEVIEKWNGDGDASMNTAKEPESVQDEEEEEEHPEQEVKKAVDSIGLGISFTLYMLFGAKILSIYEPEMDFFRALYFNFVTLTTVGLGDFIPKSHDYLIVTLIYIGIGLALTTVAIEIAADLLKKIHYAGRPMENIGNAVVWFGGKRMTMKALVKNLGDKFNIPQEELENLNIDQFVDNAIKVEKGELQTLRKPQSPVVFRDMPRPFSYSILRKSNESATLKWVDERFSKATDLSTVTEDAPADFIVNEVGSKTANNKGNRSAKERQKFVVPPLELDIPFLTDSSMPSSFDQDYLQTFTYSKR
ncbi:hypothetical protein WR25_10040 [Diploscapter pachys]|uniref:Potassium channel domain-containing protein n=1 Tax=Diploscapter pachys TaxID=2018661 RepID=A0A2A2JAF3_9BILA|nr:hypothetical protein WR25_10040 [Diploscapter pachys]